MSVVGGGGGGGGCKKSLFFNIFTRIFAYFPDFTIFSFLEQIKESVFYVEIKIANTKTTKTMLTECIASALSRYTGVIKRRVKENSAVLHLNERQTLSALNPTCNYNIDEMSEQYLEKDRGTLRVPPEATTKA